MTPPGDRRRGIARRVLDPVGTEWPSKRTREATAFSRPHRPRGSVAGGAQWRDVKWRSDDALGRSARKAGDNLAKGSVRHFGARSDPMRVLSGLASTAGERRPARLLRSSRSPKAGATAACARRRPGLRRCGGSLPNVAIVNHPRCSEQGRDGHPMQHAPADFAFACGPDRRASVGRAWSCGGGHNVVGEVK
jgi:hypothetical protein